MAEVEEELVQCHEPPDVVSDSCFSRQPAHWAVAAAVAVVVVPVPMPQLSACLASIPMPSAC